MSEFCHPYGVLVGAFFTGGWLHPNCSCSAELKRAWFCSHLLAILTPPSVFCRPYGTVFFTFTNRFLPQIAQIEKIFCHPDLTIRCLTASKALYGFTQMLLALLVVFLDRMTEEHNFFLLNVNSIAKGSRTVGYRKLPIKFYLFMVH